MFPSYCHELAALFPAMHYGVMQPVVVEQQVLSGIRFVPASKSLSITEPDASYSLNLWLNQRNWEEPWCAWGLLAHKTGETGHTAAPLASPNVAYKRRTGSSEEQS